MNASRDENNVPTLLAVSSADGKTPVTVYADPTTHRLLVASSAASSVAIGTPITGGTVGSVLFVGAGGLLAQDNANFFWNDTDNRLGINTNTPNTTLTVAGTGANGINLAVDAGALTLSQRLFLSNNAAGQSVALFNFGGGLSVRTLATVGSGSGTERLLMSSLGTILSTSEMAISSGTAAFIDFAATVTNTGTAAYRGIRFTATENSVGSGTDLLFHLLTGSTTRFSVQSNGAVVAASGMTIAAGSSYIWTNRSRMSSPADGVILMANNGSTDFNMLELGGSTSAFPSIKRNGTGIDIRLADDSAFAPLAASTLNLNKTITPGGTTGAQVINNPAGSVNFAAAAGSLVVTNSLVTANSVIIATVATNDASMLGVKVVATGGSFTLFADTPPTGETRVNFLVIN